MACDSRSIALFGDQWPAAGSSGPCDLGAIR